MALHRDEGAVDAWEFYRDVDPRLATICALDRLEAPDMRVVVTGTTGDTITIEIVEGSLLDPDSLLYVERRGLFEIVRVERWPGEGNTMRDVIVLRAFPSS